MKKKSNSLFFILHQLWQHISKRRKLQFGLILVLTIITSLAEVVSLGTVFPFISILTQPENLFDSPSMTGIIHFFGITQANKMILPLTIAFGLSAVIAGALRLLLLWVNYRLSNAMAADLSVDVYRKTLYQPYMVHLQRSSSEVISGITQKVGLASTILISCLTVITSTFLFVSIIFTLIIVDPVVAVGSAMCFGFAYFIIGAITQKKLVSNSNIISGQQTRVVKALQEGLGAIRDVLLDGTQKLYIGIYSNSMKKLQTASGQNSFISQAPRYAMESFGMILIAVFVLILSKRNGGVTSSLPVLAMLGLGAQRLLPILQQLYASWSTIAGGKKPMKDVIDFLNQPLPTDAFLPEPEPMTFTKSIKLNNVFFKYTENGSFVLNGLSLEIPRGARVGIIGSTGSGKSTTLDLLMGLIAPTCGNLLVDDLPVDNSKMRTWQRTVAHVPQSIFLADATVAENIALGTPVEEIDFDRIRDVASSARISTFVESLPEGYLTVVGERGSRLSGGQRQRIGIARALYKRASVLVFDEATSALDSKTEKEVMNAIDGLNKNLTIFLIAHRIATLKTCDFIAELESGKVVHVWKYNDLIQNLNFNE